MRLSKEIAELEKDEMEYEKLQLINMLVDRWCNEHFPKYTDDDFKRMAKSADIEFLQLCGECGFMKFDDQNAAWERFQYLAESAIDA